MPHRLPLRAIAFSAVVCAAGCAGLPQATAPSAKKTQTASTSAGAVQQPAPASPAQGTTVEAQLESAHALRIQGRLPEATRALAQLVLVAPDNPRVVGEYGKALVQQGRADDAVAFLKRAVQLKNDDWTVYSALGVAYDQKDDRKNAAAAYDSALALHPGDASVLNNYGVSRMLAGDYDGAEKLLRRAQAAGSTNPKLAGNLQALSQMKARKAGSPVKTAGAAGPAGASASDAAGADAQPRTIVMQQVPADAPNATAAAKTRKLSAVQAAKARAAKAKLAKGAPKPPPAPALRTAAQGE